MKKQKIARKLRNAKTGVGVIYSIEPSIRKKGKTFNAVYVATYKARTMYGGMIGLPPGSVVIVGTLDGYGRPGFYHGVKLIDLDGVTLSHSACLRRIGYKLVV